MNSKIAKMWMLLCITGFLVCKAPCAFAQGDFGQQMLSFVKDSAHKKALQYIDFDYTARAVTTFQVNLDRSRHLTNQAFKTLCYTDTLIRRLHDIYLLTSRLDSTGQEIPGNVIVNLISISNAATGQRKPLAYHWEMIAGAHNIIKPLSIPYTFEAFRGNSLNETPYYFLLSSIVNSRPDFEGEFGAGVKTDENGNGSSDGNIAMAAITIVGMYELYKDKQEYDRQMKKLEQAIDLLPSVMPADSVKYAKYLDGYTLVRTIYNKELNGLDQYLDSLHVTISDRYALLSDMKTKVDNLLLKNRVRDAYNALGLNAFLLREQELRMIAGADTRLRHLKSEASRFYLTATTSDSMLAVYGSLESLQETASDADSFITYLLSAPVYKPLYAGLPDLQQWFKVKASYARLALEQGFPGSGGAVHDTSIADMAYTSPVQDALARSLVQGLKTRAESGSGIGLLSSKANTTDHLLSVSTGFGGYNTGAPFHTSFSTVGNSVWFRSSDGSYIRDWRNPGSILVAKVRKNLDKRMTENKDRLTKSLKEASENAPVRTEEISTQVGIVNSSRTLTSLTRATFPRSGTSPVPLPGNNAPIPEEGEMSIPPLIQETNLENDRNQRYLQKLPEADRNSQRIKEFEALHGKYLKYARALEIAGFTREAVQMLHAAVNLRAAITGYSTRPVVFPGFYPPHIPYNPLTLEDYRTVAQRSAYYGAVHEILKDRSLWFRAAEEVTSSWAMSIADDFSFSNMVHYIVETNKYLFIENSANARRLQDGNLDFSFVTSDGKVVNFRGLKGKELDYALVEYEQTKVDEFTNRYRIQYPDISLNTIHLAMNIFLRNYPFDSALMAQAIKDMGPDFNFANYEDRVRLGKRMIDLLYAQRP